MKTTKRHLAFWLTIITIGVSSYLVKTLVVGLDTPLVLGGLTIFAERNYGLAMGMFSDAPVVLKNFLSCVLGIMISFFSYGAFLLVHDRRVLFAGALILGGALSNLMDRISLNYVVDYFRISIFGLNTAVFNLGDLFQILGYGITFFYMFHEIPKILKHEKRTQLLINADFQIRYSLTVAGFGTALLVFFSLLYYAFWNHSLDAMGVAHGSTDRVILHSFLFVSTIMFVLFLSSLLAVSFLLSHKIVGPIYAIEKYFLNFPESFKEELKLRKTDEFRNLEKAINGALSDFRVKTKPLRKTK